jgi:hypothetical protein
MTDALIGAWEALQAAQDGFRKALATASEPARDAFIAAVTATDNAKPGPPVGDGTADARRGKKIEELLALPQRQRPQCRALVEEALDIMAAADRAAAYPPATKGASDRFERELRRFQVECHRASKAGVVLPLKIDRVIENHKRWNALAPKPMRTRRQRTAVRLTCDLAAMSGVKLSSYPKGKCYQVAKLLLGNSPSDLFQHLREEINRRR